MPQVSATRLVALGMAAIVTLAATFGATATFTASSPGEPLRPVGDAGSFVRIIQGQEHLLWTSLGGAVTSYTVVGWPTQHGEVELGGAMTIERSSDGSAGVIEVGEAPKSVQFETAK